MQLYLSATNQLKEDGVYSEEVREEGGRLAARGEDSLGLLRCE